MWKIPGAIVAHTRQLMSCLKISYRGEMCRCTSHPLVFSSRAAIWNTPDGDLRVLVHWNLNHQSPCAWDDERADRNGHGVCLRDDGGELVLPSQKWEEAFFGEGRWVYRHGERELHISGSTGPAVSVTLGFCFILVTGGGYGVCRSRVFVSFWWLGSTTSWCCFLLLCVVTVVVVVRVMIMGNDPFGGYLETGITEPRER